MSFFIMSQSSSSSSVSSFLSLLVRHSDQLDVSFPLRIKNDIHSNSYNTYSDMLTSRRIVYLATDETLRQYLAVPFVFNSTEHQYICPYISHYIECIITRSNPSGHCMYRIDVDAKQYYMSWIEKLFVVVMATFMGQHAITKQTWTVDVPGSLRSLLWGCYFSSATSKPVFIPRWDKDQEAKRHSLFEIALDYNNWQYLENTIPPIEGPQSLNTPSNQIGLFKLIMCNEILREMGIADGMSKRLGLLRYMMSIRIDFTVEQSLNHSAIRSFFTNTTDNEDLFTQLHINTQTINGYLMKGRRDYSTWCKSKSSDYYMTDVEPLIRTIPMTKQYEYRMNQPRQVHAYSYCCLSKVNVIEILRHNRDITLLPIYCAPSNEAFEFVFIPYIAAHFLSYIRVILPLFRIDPTSVIAHDVYNPITQQVEALIVCTKRTFQVIRRFGGMSDLPRHNYLLAEALMDAKEALSQVSTSTRELGSKSVDRLYEILILLKACQNDCIREGVVIEQKEMARLLEYTASYLQPILMLSSLPAIRTQLASGKYCQSVGHVLLNWFLCAVNDDTNASSTRNNSSLLDEMFNPNSPYCINKLNEIQDEKQQALADEHLANEFVKQWIVLDTKKESDVSPLTKLQMEQIKQLLVAVLKHYEQKQRIICANLVSMVMCIPRSFDYDEQLISFLQIMFDQSLQPSTFPPPSATTTTIILPFVEREETQVIHPVTYSILQSCTEKGIRFETGTECPMMRDGGMKKANTNKSVRKRRVTNSDNVGPFEGLHIGQESDSDSDDCDDIESRPTKMARR